jgi:hypothetical protein
VSRRWRFRELSPGQQYFDWTRVFEMLLEGADDIRAILER